jgi:trans-aconitate 2-methyltransferase
VNARPPADQAVLQCFCPLLMEAHDWDAASYKRVAAPVWEWGRALVRRLELHGDEAVLDAGCGSGEVTCELIARVPDGRVIGVDVSPSMIGQARAAVGEAARWQVGDLLELELDQPVDVVFSNATFHWILDHDRLFPRLFAVLRPGGQLLAQCGGRGNVATVVAALEIAAREPPFAEYLAGLRVWNFQGPEETVTRLERAGFVDAEAGLHTELVHPDDAGEYVATMIIGPHLDRLPPELRDLLIERVAGQLHEPVTIEYVRLTMSARRPS